MKRHYQIIHDSKVEKPDLNETLEIFKNDPVGGYHSGN